MEDLELQAVGVVEEHRVVPRRVGVFLRLALEQRPVVPQPLRALVDDGPRERLEREMMEADRVAVVGGGLALRLPQPDRRLRAADVPDRLAALPLNFAQAMPAERAQQLAIEREAALDRGDDEVDVMNAHEPTKVLQAP